MGKFAFQDSKCLAPWQGCALARLSIPASRSRTPPSTLLFCPYLDTCLLVGGGKKVPNSLYFFQEWEGSQKVQSGRWWRLEGGNPTFFFTGAGRNS